MRKNIGNVIAAFKAKRAHHEATCSTDGDRIYSYRMLIAERRDNGSIWVMPRDVSPSRTTTSQIDAVSRSI